MMLPDIGVGACGKNTATQSFSSFSSRYPICQPSSILTKAGFKPLALSICSKAFRHTFYQLIMREAAEKRRLRPAAKAAADNGAGYNACDEGNEDQH